MKRDFVVSSAAKVDVIWSLLCFLRAAFQNDEIYNSFVGVNV